MLLARRKPVDIREILLEVSQLDLNEAPGVIPHERRSGTDRRCGVDRRRAHSQFSTFPEGFKDRRSKQERRSGYDRREFISL